MVASWWLDGGFVVVWRDNDSFGGDGSNSSIKAQRYDAAGVPKGSEFLVNTNTANFQSVPSVAGLSDGGFIITWHDFDPVGGEGNALSVKAQRYDVDGQSSGGEFVVNTNTANNQLLPTVTALLNGGFVVVWRDDDPAGGDGSNRRSLSHRRVRMGPARWCPRRGE